MKLQVTQENLARALSTVSRVAAARSSLPILANVLLKTDKNRLHVAATNLEIAITQNIGGKVSDQGSITVPARLMQDFVSSLPNSTINLELDEQKLHLSADQYDSTINGISPDDFPTLPTISSKKSYKIAASQLKKALQQTIIAASIDEARPVLTGIYFHTHKGSLYLVATDSYRLAEKRLMELGDELNLIVPASAMQDLLRILGDDDELVEMVFDDSQVLFKYGETELISRLIEGSFPDYRQLIPAKSDISFTIKHDDFVNITKVSALFARESAGSITLKVSEKDKQVSIKSVASQVGENTSSAEAKVKGDGEVTLNSRFLLDALQSIESDDITFRFSGKINPCVLSAAGTKDNDYLHIVMPLRS